MDYKDLQKKQNKIGIIVSMIFFLSLVGLIIGGVFGFGNDNILLGCLLVIPCLLTCITSIVWVILYIRKTNKIIYSLLSDEFGKAINKEEGKKEFKTLNGESVSFDYTSFKINDEEYKYSDEIGILGCYSSTVSKFVHDIRISLIIAIEDDIYDIPFDKDLLNELIDKNVSITNIDDMKYLYNHLELGAERIVKILSSNIKIPYMPVIFEKNEKEEREIKKTKKIEATKLTIYVVLLFVGFLTFALSSNFLGEIIIEGITYEPISVFTLIVRIIFSLVILGCAFIKNEHKLKGKISLVAYVVLYWLLSFILPSRFNVFVGSIFVFIFFIQGFRYTKDIYADDFALNRYMFIGMIVFLTGFIKVMNLCIVGGTVVTLISTLIAAVLMGLLFMHQQIKYNNNKKKNFKKSNLIGLCLVGVFFIAANLYVSIISANAVFDTSEEIIVTEKVVELNDSGKYSSASATIIINDEKLDISITDEMYKKLEIGDTITVVYNEGAFGIKYYQIKSK